MDHTDTIISETGDQLLLRLKRRERVTELEPALFVPNHFGAGSVVQISGEANTGKSELMLHFITKCIMPYKWNNHPCGGLEIEVVYLDNDRHFHLPRLIVLLEAKLNACRNTESIHQGLPATDQQVHDFIQDCLTRLYLINGCADSGQFIITLQYIKSFLATVKYNCSILIIDSISAFYYEDRMRHLDSLSQLDAHYQHIEVLLRSLAKKDGFTILFTKQDLINSKEFSFLGNSLEKLISWKIKLSRESVPSSRTRADIQLNNNYWQNFFNILDDGIHFGNIVL